MVSNSRHPDSRRSSKTQNGKRKKAVHSKGHTAKPHSKQNNVNKKQIQRQGKKRKQGSKKQRKKYWTTGKKVLMAVCILFLLCVLGAIGVIASKINLLQMVTLDKDNLDVFGDMQYEEEGYLNVALFGVDTRETDESMGTRSDTIMIASVNLETKDVKIVSVYRDTLMQQEDGTYHKANHAYSEGGAEEAIAMLNRNLDMDIQHYVTVDFAALVHVIDALGGVEIEVTEEEIPYINGYAVEIIKNTGVDTWAVTEPGYQTLTGVQATAYARIRHTAGDDYKRTERQRTVLLKIAEKLQSADVTALVNIIDEVFPMVETNFTLPEILMYAKDIAKFKIGETNGFPFEKDTMSYGSAGDSVIALTLEKNVILLHRMLFPGLEYTPSEQVLFIDSEIGWIHGGDYYMYSSSNDETMNNTTDTGTTEGSGEEAVSGETTTENYAEEFY